MHLPELHLVRSVNSEQRLNIFNAIIDLRIVLHHPFLTAFYSTTIQVIQYDSSPSIRFKRTVCTLNASSKMIEKLHRNLGTRYANARQWERAIWSAMGTGHWTMSKWQQLERKYYLFVAPEAMPYRKLSTSKRQQNLCRSAHNTKTERTQHTGLMVDIPNQLKYARKSIFIANALYFFAAPTNRHIDKNLEKY